MQIQKLSLAFFKNHSDFRIETNKRVIGISGLNGMGKTNILDAIHLLCIGKSYFSGTDVQCIQHDQPQAGIIARLEKDDDEIKVKFKRGGRKKIEKNGVPYKRIVEHLGNYLAVVIAPGDIALIYDGNESRRSFINQTLSQVDRDYLESLVKYNKLMEYRNRHLKQDEVDLALIQTLDDQITPLVAVLYQARVDFLKVFSLQFSEMYNLLSDKKEVIELIYNSQLAKYPYQELVEMNRSKDLAVQRSFSGVHKDEIDIEINGVALKKYGSQGQIKSALIALKLAEFQYLKEETGLTPVLLLDDIFEKIDNERAKVLTQLIKNDNFGQIFITDTEEERLKKFCEEIGKSFELITLGK